MPSKSKSQQRFFGVVKGIQKGKSGEGKAKKAAGTMSKKDVDDFASTKHKGLPNKVKQETRVRQLIKKMVQEMLDEQLAHYVMSNIITEAKPIHHMDAKFMYIPKKDVKKVQKLLKLNIRKGQIEIEPKPSPKVKGHYRLTTTKKMFNDVLTHLANARISVREGVNEDFAGVFPKEMRKKFDKQRREQSEVLGYTLTGKDDIKVEIDDATIKEQAPPQPQAHPGPIQPKTDIKDNPFDDVEDSDEDEKEVEEARNKWGVDPSEKPKYDSKTDDPNDPTFRKAGRLTHQQSREVGTLKNYMKSSPLLASKDEDEDEIEEAKARNYKEEYKKYGSSDKAKKYRAELNKYNRQKGTYGNGDGLDASHKNGKIVGFEEQSKNRGRAEKSRLKKEGKLKEDYKNSEWEVYLKDEKGREKIVKKAKSKRAATILYNRIIKSDDYYEVGMRAIKEGKLSEAKILVYKVNDKKVQKFLKKYPKVEKSMKPFLKGDILSGYKKWIRWKDKNEDKLGGKPDKVDSKSFGSKVFWKHDWNGVDGWAEVFQYLHTLDEGKLNEAKETIFDVAARVMKDKQNQNYKSKVGMVKVDMQSANLLVKVFKKVNPKMKKILSDLGEKNPAGLMKTLWAVVK